MSLLSFNGDEQERYLDGNLVSAISSNFTADSKFQPKSLNENANLCFMGVILSGEFDVSQSVASTWLQDTGNPNGRPNSDVLRPFINAADILGRSRNEWVIDFGLSMSLENASLYEKPFIHVERHVKPVRATNNRAVYKQKWWLYAESRPALRAALTGLTRYIVTPVVAKHRLFAWANAEILAAARLYVFATESDYMFGILHSRAHEVWSLKQVGRHGVGNYPTYNNTTCFDTFPFPWPPSKEPTDSPLVTAIAEAAKELVEKRDGWLNPVGPTEAELKKRTLTKLYNERPTWLDLAHKKLDNAVFAAYGWPDTLTDDDILGRLLVLNHERAR